MMHCQRLGNPAVNQMYDAPSQAAARTIDSKQRPRGTQCWKRVLRQEKESDAFPVNHHQQRRYHRDGNSQQ